MMTFTKSAIAALLISTAAFAAPASANDFGLDEARFGGTWAQPDWLDANHAEDDQFGINAELLFRPINIDLFGVADGETEGFLYSIMNPRAHLGGMVNFDDDGTSYGYAGLTWQFGLTEALFLEGGFGLALNNGEERPSATRAGLGSAITFRESIALGVNVTENITALIQLEHLSHAEVFDDQNRGLSNISARIGYKF
ncbi:acyloxyacyl hydrolase [Ahrensia sp. R2A130]|uniref:acyloxyacyl hydrolase n=1 Tax=Ahrensia sp. R2A130 TaxID=744979 RepID=UPI0018DC31FD|nr:acyloxyacyl hydrolase [Ahrensia sp. R2A130]